MQVEDAKAKLGKGRNQSFSLVIPRVQTQTMSTPQSKCTSLRSDVLQRKRACGQHTVRDGECEECKKKGQITLQRSPINPAEPTTVPPIVHEVLRSPGEPLDSTTRAFFESRFGHDFSQVRVHTDARAADSAQAVNALAFTVGRNVVFSAGEYAPSTTIGRRLLAHELSHVVQQAGQHELRSGLRISPADDRHERAADSMAEALLSSSSTAFTPPSARLGVRQDEHKGGPHSPSANLMREPKPLSPPLKEKVNRVEKLIEKNWPKYIEKAKFRSPLREKIIWYDDTKELYLAKHRCARELAERDIARLAESEKTKLIEKYKSLTLAEKPSFEDIKEYAIGSSQLEYFLGLGGEEVPAFFCQTNGMIYLTGENVGRIAHEAFHYYSSPEFRSVLGAYIDEGMTQFLAEEIERDYAAEYWREGGLPLEITAYGENVKSVEELLKKGALKKDKVIEGYLTGGKQILREIKKTKEKVLRAPEQKPQGAQTPAPTPPKKETISEPAKH